MKNLRKSLVGQVSGLALFAMSVSASATHSWGDYHWAVSGNVSFILQVVDSVTGDWDGELDTALFGDADGNPGWASYPAVLDLEITSSDDSTRVRKRCNGVTGQIRVCNESYGANGWLGLASIWIDGNGHITKGTAQMNDTYASYWTIPGEKQHVMCQEVGHLFGLGHTSEDGSSQMTCMDYSTDPESLWPNVHDFDELVAKYGHTDGYDSFDSGTSFDSGGCTAPAGKGCNKNGARNGAGETPPMGIRIHANKNFELWVAPGKDGGLVIHHVRLVPEEYDIQ